MGPGRLTWLGPWVDMRLESGPNRSARGWISVWLDMSTLKKNNPGANYFFLKKAFE